MGLDADLAKTSKQLVKYPERIKEKLAKEMGRRNRKPEDTDTSDHI